MKKRRTMLLSVLFFVLIVSITLIASNNLNSIYAAEIRPYNLELSLTVSYGDTDSNGLGELTMTTDAAVGVDTTGYTYQYWIKTKVETDKGTDSLAKNQYIWQRLAVGETAGFSVGATSNIGKLEVMILDEEDIPIPNPIYLDESEKYNIIVRVKDTKSTSDTQDDVIVEELYQALTSAQVGQASIASVEVHGKAITDEYVIVNKAEPLDIKINSNLPGLTYGIYYGNTEIKTVVGNNDGENDDNAGSFIKYTVSETTVDNRIDISELAAGLHTITLKAGTATKKISLYVYDEYVASERPVITSLEGIRTGSLTTFTMKVKYADGSSITNSKLFNYTLISGGKECNLDSETPVLNADGNIDVKFTINYDGYGIYYTTGTVSRKDGTGTTGVNAYDDKIIQYYDKYVRPTNLTQTGKVAGIEKYTDITVGETVTITADGEIELTENEVGENKNYVADVRYSFYREDASGWVLIRNYSTTPTLSWIPQRPGTYNIQARIKDVNAGAYEKTVTKTYVVSGTALNGELSISVSDGLTGNAISEYEAGIAYKFTASYDGSEDVLYMFTLTNLNLGTVYLNKYTTNPNYIFIPNKCDSYKITVRVINIDSFGYKDISKDISFESSQDIQFLVRNLTPEETPSFQLMNRTVGNLEIINYSDDNAISAPDGSEMGKVARYTGLASTGFQGLNITGMSGYRLLVYLRMYVAELGGPSSINYSVNGKPQSAMKNDVHNLYRLQQNKWHDYVFEMSDGEDFISLFLQNYSSNSTYYIDQIFYEYRTENVLADFTTSMFSNNVVNNGALTFGSIDSDANQTINDGLDGGRALKIYQPGWKLAFAINFDKSIATTYDDKKLVIIVDVYFDFKLSNGKCYGDFSFIQSDNPVTINLQNNNLKWSTIEIREGEKRGWDSSTTSLSNLCMYFNGGGTMIIKSITYRYE